MSLDRVYRLGLRQPFGQAKARWESFKNLICVYLKSLAWKGVGGDGQRRMRRIMTKGIEQVSGNVSLRAIIISLCLI